MRLNTAFSVPLIILALLAASVSSWASPVTYTDRSLWLGQLSSSSTPINFDGAGDLWESITSDGYQTDGLKFVGYQFYDSTLGSYKTMSQSDPGGATNFGTGITLRTVSPQWSTYAQPYILVTVPNLNVVGFDVMTYLWSNNSYGKNVEILVTDVVGTYTQTIATLGKTANPPAFFGIIDPNPIVSVQIRAVSGQTFIDNFTYGTATLLPTDPPPPEQPGETPEIATIIMIGTGLFFVAAGRKRRMRRLAAV